MDRRIRKKREPGTVMAHALLVALCAQFASSPASAEAAKKPYYTEGPLYQLRPNPDQEEIIFGEIGVSGLLINFYKGVVATVDKTLSNTPADGKFKSGQIITGVNGVKFIVYDFWNHSLVGKFPGTAKVEKMLEPSACTMLSVRKAQPNPQVLSTSRHVLQGWVDLSDVKWDAAGKKLIGVAKVIGGEPFRVVLAGNGRKALRAAASGALARVEQHPAGGEFTTLVMERNDNGPTHWSVEFQ